MVQFLSDTVYIGIWCISGRVIECWPCNCLVMGSYLTCGYCASSRVASLWDLPMNTSKNRGVKGHTTRCTRCVDVAWLVSGWGLMKWNQCGPFSAWGSGRTFFFTLHPYIVCGIDVGLQQHSCYNIASWITSCMAFWHSHYFSFYQFNMHTHLAIASLTTVTLRWLAQLKCYIIVFDQYWMLLLRWSAQQGSLNTRPHSVSYIGSDFQNAPSSDCLPDKTQLWNHPTRLHLVFSQYISVCSSHPHIRHHLVITLYQCWSKIMGTPCLLLSPETVLSMNSLLLYWLVDMCVLNTLYM